MPGRLGNYSGDYVTHHHTDLSVVESGLYPTRPRGGIGRRNRLALLRIPGVAS